MCDHHDSASPKEHTLRHGQALEHGEAHSQDHHRLSRRDFLWSMGLAASGSVMMGGLPVRALAQPALHPLASANTDRVLVLVQLDGGNDGLNTLVPITNDTYYRRRPNLAIQPRDTLGLNGDLGFNPAMAPLHRRYQEGGMGIIQNVGYPDPDFSHFRSTDIWLSGGEGTAVEESGWAGRYLFSESPNYAEAPPERPLGVQIGGTSMLFQTDQLNLGMSISGIELFERLAESGTVFQTEGLGGTAHAAELAFVRRVANDAYRYAGAIYNAAQQGTNHATTYDSDSELANHLSIVARLIHGGLGSRIYHVSLGGFDTHSEQTDAHPNLLAELSGAVDSFLADMEGGGRKQDVLVMTFSEFGRTIWENGSSGTDHGTSAPLFFFGGSVEGGLYGPLPDLDNVTDEGDMQFGVDFRSVYATVLKQWFGLPAQEVQAVMGQAFEVLPVLGGVPTAIENDALPLHIALDGNYPNPFRHATTIRFTLRRAARVQLEVFDVQGRRVQAVFRGTLPAGTHTRPFEAANMPSGTYLARLTADGQTLTHPLSIVR
ncbi:MAG: hypothetical protein RhofKO_18300 [Rhodothermales bacterium]